MTPPTPADIGKHLQGAAEALQAGRVDEAEKHLTAVRKIAPDHPDALHLLGLVRHHQGRAKDAIGLIEAAVSAAPAVPDYASNLAALLLEIGNGDGAVTVLRKALADNPGNAMLLYEIGRIYVMAGELSTALDLLGQAAEAAPDVPDIYGALGVVYQQMGEGENAKAAYETAIELGSRDADDFFNLGTVHMNARDWDQAIARFSQAIELNPGHQRAYANIGLVLGRNTEYVDAIAPLQKAVELAPDDARSVNELVYAQAIAGDAVEGAKIGEKFVKFHPEATELHHQIAFAWLRAGEPEKSVAAADQGLGRGIHPTPALAMKSAALNELGRRDDAGALLDFDRFLKTKIQTAPAGYASIEAFNRDLVQYLLDNPTLTYAKTNRSMDKGRGTLELFDGRERGPALILKTMILEMAAEYRAERPRDSAHPFLARPPETLVVRCWGNIYDRDGRQLVHFHPTGWLSGVYYPALPEAMKTTEDGSEGCIEFGRAFHRIGSNDEPPVRLVRPVEGMMVMFPSFFGHQTIPVTSSDEPRVSIAFDLEPADAAE